MSSSDPIINLGELSKPATVLVEKISDAVGGIFKPYQIVRVARAEAVAERVRAESQIEISEVERRTVQRFLREEVRKQRNIEEITRQALPQVNEGAEPETVGDDWIANFFDKCRLVSDADMQRLWSRVLAGEANAPGSYSKRTVNFLSSLDSSEANLFTQLCSCAWYIGTPVPLIYDVLNATYKKRGLDFISLSHLDTVGLIKFDNTVGFKRIGLPKTVAVSYFGTLVTLEFPKDDGNDLQLGKVLFTKTGMDLARVCGARPDPDIFRYTLDQWKRLGYIHGEAKA